MKITKHQMFLTAVAGLVATVVAEVGSVAEAGLLINVREHPLLPNTPGQSFDILVQNPDQTGVFVSGLSFNIQVADSGPASEGGLGTVDGPNITAVDLLTGTLFASNNTGMTDAGSVPQFANWATTTSSGSLTLNPGTSTKLATVTLSTASFTSPQTWALKLGDTINGSTKYFDILGNPIVPIITDGTISVVPESMYGAIAGSLLAIFSVWRRVLARRGTHVLHDGL